MKLFRVPYRWLPRTAWRNIHGILHDLIHGVRNVLRWIPVIWFDIDWDHSALLQILEYKFRRMAEQFERHGMTISTPQIAKQLRICAVLCRRLNEEEYYENAAKAFGYGTKAWSKECSAVQNQDQEMLGRIIGKYLCHWWD
jgi:hypothetical protein